MRIFEDMKHCPMLPVNQIDEDPVRAELDRRLLTEVLGLPEELCAKDGPMDLLRRKLAAEPSIHGGKISKVTLEVPAAAACRTERPTPGPLPNAEQGADAQGSRSSVRLTGQWSEPPTSLWMAASTTCSRRSGEMKK